MPPRVPQRRSLVANSAFFTYFENLTFLCHTLQIPNKLLTRKNDPISGNIIMGRGMRFIGILLFLAGILSAQAEEYLAVLDRSEKPITGIGEAQLTVILDALRGEARNVLGRQALVLTATTTLQILRDNDKDPNCVDESCQLSLARSLQAKWLLSTNIVPSVSGGFLMQLGFYETDSGILLEMREARGIHWEALKEAAQAESRLLYQLVGQPGMVSSGPQTLVNVEILSKPLGAAIYLPSGYQGNTPSTLELATGRTKLKLAFQGYDDYHLSLEVRSDTTLHAVLLPAFGWISVQSEPTRQQVQLDDRSIGVTPILKRVTSPGKHRVIVGEEGLYYPREQQFTLSKGEHREFQLDPIPREGSIRVTIVDPKGREVTLPLRVDGETVGETPWQGQLGIGKHELEAGNARKTITIREGRPVQFDWRVKDEDGPQVTIRSTPSGADVIVGGKSSGRTPVTLRRLPGSYLVKLVKDDYIESEEQVTWGAQKTYNAVLQPMLGRLEVKVSGGEESDTSQRVLLDGRYMGKTPYSGQVPLGEHELKVGRYRTKVDVNTRRTTNVDIPYRRIRPPVKPRRGLFLGGGMLAPDWASTDQDFLTWAVGKGRQYRTEAQIGFGVEYPLLRWELGYSFHWLQFFDERYQQVPGEQFNIHDIRYGTLDLDLLLRIPLDKSKDCNGFKFSLGPGASLPLHLTWKFDGESIDGELKDPLVFIQTGLGFYAEGFAMEFRYRFFTDPKIELIPEAPFLPNAWAVILSWSK